MIVSSKISTTKLFPDFCPKIFCTFLGASWKLLGLPVGFLIYDITYYVPRKPKKLPGSPQEAQKASRKPPGSYKEFQGRNPEMISLVLWKKRSFHKDIIKLTLTHSHSNWNGDFSLVKVFFEIFLAFSEYMTFNPNWHKG